MALKRDVLDLPRPFGPYTLMRRIAVGGMAEVYVAKAKGIGGFEKLVAIKVIHPRYSEDDHFVQMLVEEAKLSVLLTHANVAQTFDLGCIDDTYCIVMEFIEGADTYRILKRAAEKRARLPVDLCAYIISEVCQGLEYAHHKRDLSGAPLHIVHRDISPQNVLVSFSGEVKIVDFGIAKAALRTGQTEVGVIKGKYYYMSPEQAWADPVDARSDIFSAGIVLHELLTGSMVYQEENLPKLLDRVRKAEVQPPSRFRRGIPDELDHIVMRALAKEPDDRFQSAHDFGQALTQFLYGHMPSFTSARMAALMAQLFPEELDEVAGARPASNVKVLSSIESVADEPTLGGEGSSLDVMKPEEFLPDARKSVIFDLGEFDDRTSGEVPSRRTPGSLEDGLEDDATVVQPHSTSDEWDDPTMTSRPLVGAERPRGGTDEWEDSTLVESEGHALSHMRKHLEKQLAAARASLPDLTASPSSRRRTRPSERPSSPLDPDQAPTAPEKVTPVLSEVWQPPTEPHSRRHDAAVPRPPTPAETAGVPPQPPVSSAPPPSHWPSAEPDTLLPAGMLGSSRPADPFAPPAATTQRLPAVKAGRGRGTLALFGALVLVAIGAGVGIRLAMGPDVPEARLEVRSNPPGARVLLDGRPVPGETPLADITGLVPEQEYELRVELSGHESFVTRFRAQAGATSQIAVLTPIRRRLRVDSDPPHATIWMDGQRLGTAPQELPPMNIGRRVRLEARLDRRRVVEETVVITESRDQVILHLPGR